MSRASAERDRAVNVMQMALLNHRFTEFEVEAMLMVAVKRMTVTEMEQLVAEQTSYEDLDDVEMSL